MLSRFVRIQLGIFAVASIVGIAAMTVVYLQAPVLLGLGRITVKLELPSAGGLYRFSNVTYRGVQVGKVTSLRLTQTGAEATMSLGSSPKIPADLTAEVHSVSAVGEQYVDLRPRGGSPPYLRDGSVIPLSAASIPQPVGPMLDKVSALLGSVPQDRLHTLLDESFDAFNGAGYDLGSLLDSGSRLASDANSVSTQTQGLIDDSGPLLAGQEQSADDTREWAHHLAGITEQLTQNDPQIRILLQNGPAAAQEVSRLLAAVKPTLPVLLANLRAIGQIAVTYRPGLEQLLVLLPPETSYYQASRPQNNPTGIPMGDFRISAEDPPACTVGFLPPSSWRSPADTTTIDTPDGLYCKLPQDSPIAVRGARNIPCMGHPGKRAPTVEICDSDQPFEPLAMRQHALGPYPLDPNLISQGVPPDDRVPGQAPIFGPLAGTPRPPDAPSPVPASSPVQGGVPLAPPDTTAPVAAPSGLHDNESGAPSVAFAHYDPRTGRYLGADGLAYRQPDLVSGGHRDWRDMILAPDS